MPRPLSYSRRHALPHSRPELGWWGVVLLLMCSLFMTSAKFSVQPAIWLPGSSNICSSGLNSLAVFSLDEQKRMYFQADEELQTAVIEEVARQHGIHISAVQRQKLATLSFIGLDIQLLPQWLAVPAQQQPHYILHGIPYSQLPEYVAASQRICRRQFERQAYFGLRADQRLPSGQVMRWLDLMQEQGVNRFNLVTEMEY